MPRGRDGWRAAGTDLTNGMVDGIRPDPAGGRSGDLSERPFRAGLWLIVQPSGTKSWIYRYRNAEGRQRKLALSPCVSKHPQRGARHRDVCGRCAEPSPFRKLGQRRRRSGSEVERGGDPAGAKAQAKVAAKAAPEPPHSDALSTRATCGSTSNRAEERGKSNAFFKAEILPRWGERQIESISEEDVIEFVELDRRARDLESRRTAISPTPAPSSAGRRGARSSRSTRLPVLRRRRRRSRETACCPITEIRLLWKATERSGRHSALLPGCCC